MIGVKRQFYLPDTDQKMQIYFLLDEKKFEEYADVAAEKYYADLEKYKEQRNAQWAEERNEYRR